MMQKKSEFTRRVAQMPAVSAANPISLIPHPLQEMMRQQGQRMKEAEDMERLREEHTMSVC